MGTPAHPALSLSVNAPILLPSLHLLSSVTVADPCYWNTKFLPGENDDWPDLSLLLSRGGHMRVKRRVAVEERNLRACTNILAEISRSRTFLAEQLGLRELQRRLASGEFQSGEELAGRLRMRVGRAYREGRLDCSLVSDLHHFFEVEFANRVLAGEDVPVGEEEEEEDIVEEEGEEEVLDEDELEHKGLLSLLSMSRRIERELGNLTMERGWNGHSEEEPDEGAFSDEAMEEEEGMICENFSRVSSSNHFVKSFQNIGIFGNHQLEPEL